MGDKQSFHYTVSTQYLHCEWRGDHDNWCNYWLLAPLGHLPLPGDTRSWCGHWTLDTGHWTHCKHLTPLTNLPSLWLPAPATHISHLSLTMRGVVWARAVGWQVPGPISVCHHNRSPSAAVCFHITTGEWRSNEKSASHINNLQAPALDVARAKTEQQQETRREAWGVNKLEY